MIKNREFLNERITEIGLGCWQLGGDWGEISEKKALEILKTAYEQGVRFFDTAAVYGRGKSERIIGTFLKTIDQKPFIATKIPRTTVPADLTAELIRSATRKSLDNLQLDRLDLTQLHCVPMESLKDEQVWATLRQLKEEGTIRHFGASVESME